MNYNDVELVNNAENHNFELWVDGHRAFIDYLQKNGKLYLIHTEVPAELKGKGAAEAIVEKVFNYADAAGIKIVPLCTYVRLVLQRHPEWNRLVA